MVTKLRGEIKRELVFGCGIAESSEYMGAVLGRWPSLSFPATLYGYELRSQKLSELYSRVQRALGGNWNQDDKFYSPCRSPGSWVSGRAYQLAPEEVRKLDRWELKGLWHRRIKAPVASLEDRDATYEAYVYVIDEGLGESAQRDDIIPAYREKAIELAKAAGSG